MEGERETDRQRERERDRERETLPIPTCPTLCVHLIVLRLLLHSHHPKVRQPPIAPSLAPLHPSSSTALTTTILRLNHSPVVRQTRLIPGDCRGEISHALPIPSRCHSSLGRLEVVLKRYFCLALFCGYFLCSRTTQHRRILPNLRSFPMFRSSPSTRFCFP